MDPRLAVVPGLVFNGIVLSWINKLEKKCECSADWRREYIKYYAIILVVFGVVRALMPTFVKNVPLLMILALAGLVNLGSILSYIPDLKKKQCECAIENDWRDNFIFWWIIISLVLTVLGSGALAFMMTRK
jgi:predicted benzoate:H+ symporter BenE